MRPEKFMTACQFPFPPTRVNHLFILGPRFHFDRISEDQLELLGVRQSRGAGVAVRKLRDGRYNVAIDSSYLRTRDSSFTSFLRGIMAPQSHPIDEPMSQFDGTDNVPLDEI
jgi:hypothetical protein